MSIRRSWVPLVCAVCAIVAGYVLAGSAWGAGFPLDDAWIHMVYGRSLYEGGGFAYNTGSAGSGATSPLWALVAAAAHAVAGGGPASATWLKVFGLASHALAAALAAHVARRATASEYVVPIVAGVVVALCPALAFASISGMEVSLASALLLATLAAAADKRPVLTAISASLAISTRPEAVAIPFVVILASRGLSTKAALGRAALVSGGAFVLPALWTIRNLVATGHAIPSTIAAKALPKNGSTFDTLRTAFLVMLGEVRPMGVVVGWILVAMAIVLGARKVRAVWRNESEDDGDVIVASGALIGLAWVIGLCVHTEFYTPQWFYFLRYPLPPLPLFLVCAVVMVARIGTALASRLGKPRLSMVILGVIGFAAANSEIVDWPRMRASYAHDVDGITSVQVAVGKFLAENLPKSSVVWSPDAGAIRYFGGQRVVDLEKLNTPALSWAPNAIVLIVPYGDRAWFGDAAPNILFEAPATWRSRPVPPQWPGPMPTQVVVFCPPDRTVELTRENRLRARGRCAKLD